MTTHIVMLPETTTLADANKLKGKQFPSAFALFKHLEKTCCVEEAVLLSVSEFVDRINEGNLPVGLSDCFIADVTIKKL